MSSDNRKNERRPEDVPLGSGLADFAKRLIIKRKERMAGMNKGGSKNKDKKDNR